MLLATNKSHNYLLRYHTRHVFNKTFSYILAENKYIKSVTYSTSNADLTYFSAGLSNYDRDPTHVISLLEFAHHTSLVIFLVVPSARLELDTQILDTAFTSLIHSNQTDTFLRAGITLAFT